MLIEERFVVKAPTDKVWAFLMNPDVSGPCVPGCEKVEVVDDQTYLVRVKVKIAFVSLAFKIKVQITSMNPPFHLETVAMGEESSLTSYIRAKNVVDLKTLRGEKDFEGIAPQSEDHLSAYDLESFRQIVGMGIVGCRIATVIPVETEVSYRSEISLFGKLGTMGQGVVKGKTKQIGKAFAEAVKRRLEAQTVDGGSVLVETVRSRPEAKACNSVRKE